MSKPDEQLVQRIAEEVLAAMRSEGPGVGEGAPANSGKPTTAPAGGSAGGPAGDGKASAPPARLRPPVGVCTGDYSKFAELIGPIGGQHLEGSGANTGRSKGEAPGPGDAEVPALSGIVTAQQLEAAIKAAHDGVAVVAAGVRLTPLAADFARQHPDKIRRLSAAAEAGSPAGRSPNTASPTPAATSSSASSWLWWADSHCPAVQSLTAEHRDRLRPSAAPRTDTGLVEVVRDLAGLVAGKQVAGGLLFVRSAARAVCYANRCTVLRAVVGTCGETIDEGLKELAANVLVIEYPHVSPATMKQMTERVLDGSTKLPAHVARHLAELHCK